MRLHTSILTVILVNFHLFSNNNRTTSMAAINRRRKPQRVDGRPAITGNPNDKHKSYTQRMETTAEQEVLGGEIPSNLKVERRGEIKETHKNDNTSLIVILVSLGVAGLVCLVAVTLIIVVILRKKREKKKEEGAKTNRAVKAKKPRKMEAANINATKFTHGGALVLATKLQGPVVHAEADSSGESIHTIQFDPHLNEIVDIGSDVEVMPDTGDTTSTEVGAVANRKKTRMTTLRKPVNKTATRNPAHRTSAAGRKPLKMQNPQSKPLLHAESIPKRNPSEP